MPTYYIGGQGGDGENNVIGPYRSERRADEDCKALNASIGEDEDYRYWVGVMHHPSRAMVELT